MAEVGRARIDGMKQDMPKWTTILRRLVKPEVKKEPEWMEWSTLDLYFQEMYSSFIFLYKPKSNVLEGDSVIPVDRLIESLGKVLVHFYPFAGRLIKDKKGELARLYCNNEGALFTHKRYDGIASEMIDEDQFQPNEHISGLFDIDPHAQTYDPSGLPTLIIQVTDFECGTRCLSTSWSHTVADGFSGFHFLRSWAETSRGEPISLMPVHCRSLLTPRKSSPILDGAPVRFLNNYAKVQTDQMELTMPEEGVGFKIVKFSKRKIEELKAEGRDLSQSRSSDGHGRTPSTADCISAHFWRLITAIRKHEPQELARFGILVNGRSRLKDFPAGYFGNCLLFPTSVTTVGELLSKPLSYGATVIQDAVQAVDDEVVRGTTDWSSVNRWNLLSVGDEPFMPGDPKFNVHCVQASWLNRFPFFELDFGSGRPSAALRNGFRMNQFPGAMFFVLPSSTTSVLGDLNMSVFAEKSVLEKLCDQL